MDNILFLFTMRYSPFIYTGFILFIYIFVFSDRGLGDDDAEPVSREPSPCEDTLETSVAMSAMMSSLDSHRAKVTVATQTGHEAPDLAFNPDKMTVDKHCYECKVRYRDPKPQDLVMYLHAWKYKVILSKKIVLR